MCATDLGSGVPSAGGCPELGERVRALVDVARARSPPPSEVAIGDLRREIRSADDGSRVLELTDGGSLAADYFARAISQHFVSCSRR